MTHWLTDLLQNLAIIALALGSIVQSRTIRRLEARR